MSISKWWKNFNNPKMEICYWANRSYQSCVHNGFYVSLGEKGGRWYVGQAFMESPFCSHPFSAFLIVPYGLGWRAAVQHDKSFYWGSESFVDFKHRVAEELATDKEFLKIVENLKEKNGGKWTW